MLGLFAGYSIGAESIPPAPLPRSGSALQAPTDTLIPGDGMFYVAEGDHGDVRPGVYHSSGNATPCIWRRFRNPSGESSALIAGDTSRSDAYVLIKDGEYFDTTGCTTWQRVQHPSGTG
ncbi:hypothetical protein ACPCSE_30085 [Streptomyces cellulosae]